MARIKFDDEKDRIFQVGLDRGVLYLKDQPGVAWNGLTSFEDSPAQSILPVYFDGRKIMDFPTVGDFSAKIKALTYPDQFSACQGLLEVETGLYSDNQPKKSFDLSFRTLVGDALVGQKLAYKIHIMYGLVAQQETTKHETLDDSNVSPIEFSWVVSSKPAKFDQYRPTAYLIADTRDMSNAALADLEAILYGDSGSDPYLPPIDILFEILENSYDIVITDYGDGTWSATGASEFIAMLTETSFQITGIIGGYDSPTQYHIQST